MIFKLEIQDPEKNTMLEQKMQKEACEEMVTM
jgi:hypothetical protein